METKVRNYTDKELLDYVSKLSDFKGFPKDYWILGIQSNEDTLDTFDDKIYLFKGEQFIAVTTGTTNTGKDGLFNFSKYNKNGVFVWKTNQWVYNCWSSLNWDLKTKFLHNGKMIALRQHANCYHYRDGNKNTKVEEIGKLYFGTAGCNFHLNTYNKPGIWNKIKKWLIGGWSLGCVVPNDPDKYYNDFMSVLYEQKYTTYCLIPEF